MLNAQPKFVLFVAGPFSGVKNGKTFGIRFAIARSAAAIGAVPWIETLNHELGGPGVGPLLIVSRGS